MKTFNREEIFQKFEIIRNFVANFQLHFFDEEYDSKEDEMFDALNFTGEIEKKGYSLRVPSKTILEHSKNLSVKIKELGSFLNTKEFIILSHLKLDFFGNLNHSYSKVQKSYVALSEHFPTQSFKETLRIKLNDIDDFIDKFFWLERCDPSIPEYIFWFDSNQQYCFYLCKYGNIHLIDFMSNKELTETSLKELGFFLDDVNQFEQNAIEGRELKL